MKNFLTIFLSCTALLLPLNSSAQSWNTNLLTNPCENTDLDGWEASEENLYSGRNWQAITDDDGRTIFQSTVYEQTLTQGITLSSYGFTSTVLASNPTVVFSGEYKMECSAYQARDAKAQIIATVLNSSFSTLKTVTVLDVTVEKGSDETIIPWTLASASITLPSNACLIQFKIVGQANVGNNDYYGPCFDNVSVKILNPDDTPTYTITQGTQENCTITSAPTTAAENSTVSITAEPSTGYEIGEFEITLENGTIVNYTVDDDDQNTATFTMPSGNVTVTPIAYKTGGLAINCDASDYGTITPNVETASKDDEITITITPNSDYRLANSKATIAEKISVLTTDGTSIDVTADDDNSYTAGSECKFYFTMPTNTDVTVTAYFEKVKNIKVTIDEDIENGSLSIDNEDGLYNYGDYVVITCTPDADYALSSLSAKVNGSGDGSYSFQEQNDGTYKVFVQADKDFTISASFIYAKGVQITAVEATGGSIDLSDYAQTDDDGNITSYAADYDTEVTLKYNIDEGYALRSVVESYTSSSGSTLSTTLTSDNFTMPMYDVTLTPTFTKATVIDEETFSDSFEDQDNSVSVNAPWVSTQGSNTSSEERYWTNTSSSSLVNSGSKSVYVRAAKTIGWLMTPVYLTAGKVYDISFYAMTSCTTGEATVEMAVAKAEASVPSSSIMTNLLINKVAQDKYTPYTASYLCQETGTYWVGLHCGNMATASSGALYVDDVTIELGDPYSITCSDSEYGTIESDVTTAYEASTVNFTVTPSEGYQLESVTVTADATSATVSVTEEGTDENGISSFSFSMPAASDVTISANFDYQDYDITIVPTKYGTVWLSQSSAHEGETIYIFISNVYDNDYYLDGDIIITADNSAYEEEIICSYNEPEDYEGDDYEESYSFEMPFGTSVTITVPIVNPDDPTATRESDALTVVAPFPNPTADAFIINLGNAKVNATIYDLSGKPMQKVTLEGETRVSLTGYPQGLYTLKADNGKSYRILKK